MREKAFLSSGATLRRLDSVGVERAREKRAEKLFNDTHVGARKPPCRLGVKSASPPNNNGGKVRGMTGVLRSHDVMEN
jgi:hypothetical protein